ncbi:hypothetical protein evm_005524 [Chilo suppressalis]|nr:hypothetical protein evm_005524 [Chilo suppressalis]
MYCFAECGAHGKFEYCLSRQPGCVVGCHCHPGYYFDTDTKICEPNLKLTQFRRNFNLEPTRIPVINYESMTFTTLNPVDEKVEAIAKDTDDLGDWLYNQFFKTIENQVINKTDSEKLNTRRSGNSRPVKPKKRSRKKSKKPKKKKHTIKKGLRSKLLRITEDDSLFDSSSTESDSSSSGSSSDSSDDHDHRKIVMINKKPTPPLPSFIFLPNVDTPFYPPIGLPVPPIPPPMYPMVPVPPVGMVFPWTTTTTMVATKSETPSTTISSTSVSSTTVSTTTQETSPSISDKPPNTPESSNPGLRNMGRAGRHKEQQYSPNNNMGLNNKMLQKIQAKMKKRNKKAHARNELEDIDILGPPFTDMPVDKSAEYHPQSIGDTPKQEDVDFKYLSQLIHKVDLNKTVPSFMANEVPNYGDAISAITRKSYQSSAPIYPYNFPNNEKNIPKTVLHTSHKQRPVSKADDVNDSYFTNLGKQIASLIRKINSDGMEQQIDIELQRQNTHDIIQATNMLSEHRFLQGRSYWERFVRSPLNSFLSFFKKNDADMHSNEHLISIENQVNVATAIARPFSLDELENMANIMEQTNLKQKHVQYHPTKRTTTLNDQYKFNLLPQLNRQINVKVTLTGASGEVSRPKKEQVVSMPYQPYTNAIMHPPPKVHPQSQKQDLNLTKINRTRSAFDMSKLNALKKFLQLQPLITPLHQQVSRIVQRNVTNAKPPTANHLIKYNLNPFVLNYKSVNYVNNNHNINKYHMQRSFLPYHLPIYKPKPTKSSYFHHESHHFDYFDK